MWEGPTPLQAHDLGGLNEVYQISKGQEPSKYMRFNFQSKEYSFFQ